MAVFKSTGTTTALINAVKPYIKGGTLLDLGCGNGPVGIGLWKAGIKLFASDIDIEAVDSIKHLDIVRGYGSLFEPWKGMKFDYIVDDVSGVAEEVAKVSPWFDDVPCDSGDGSKLVCEVIRQAGDHLNPNGKLFFPIVSLSNVNKIKDTAKEHFNVTLLSHTEFPLPKEMYKHKELLYNNGIEVSERFGIIMFYTEIYMADV